MYRRNFRGLSTAPGGQRLRLSSGFDQPCGACVWWRPDGWGSGYPGQQPGYPPSLSRWWQRLRMVAASRQGVRATPDSNLATLPRATPDRNLATPPSLSRRRQRLCMVASQQQQQAMQQHKVCLASASPRHTEASAAAASASPSPVRRSNLSRRQQRLRTVNRRQGVSSSPRNTWPEECTTQYTF